MKAWSQSVEVNSFTNSLPLVAHVSCDGSGGQGGAWAWLELSSGSFRAGASAARKHSNSTFLEAHALRRAVEDTVGHVLELHLYSDCRSVCEAFEDLLAGRPVVGSAAWLGELRAAVLVARNAQLPVSVSWVRGHEAHVGNRVVDRLANWARRCALSGRVLDVASADAMVRQVSRDVCAARESVAA